MRPLTVAALLLALLAAFAVIQNTDVVTVRLLLWDFSMSRVVLILLMLGTGFLLGFATAKLTGRRDRS